ncbi:RNA polymerase sigma factor [Actinomadura rubrisoli]|uniref:RNA polymerase sigma factor n=1 Tax=Actinomadura rubrisoli TaxID=2530368 RepID=A0A4R5B8X4_9ACTN|nr:RNA polymerase sigma factor [Actinomadura rubrisoli]
MNVSVSTPPPRLDGEPAGEVRDAVLIERSRTDPERFAPLFDRHAVSIHRYIAQRLGADTADDLMAETFLVAFRQRHRYDVSRLDARPWLFGIATNLMARHRAAEVRKYRLLARSSVQGRPLDEAAVQQVIDRVDAQGLHGALASGLAALPRRLRDVLLLFAWAELSYDEIAQALDIPVGTVRSRLFRARRRLRDALGGDGSEEVQP